jgi:Derlin-2/3
MRQPVAGVGDSGNPFKEWLAELGFVTKLVLFSCVFAGAGCTFKWLDAMSLVLDWNLIVSKFQIWRLLTNFVFAGPFSFNFAVFVYVFYTNCKNYEINPFNTGAGGSSADFLWMLFICMGALLLIAYLFGMPVMSDPLLCCVMYVWSRRDPNAQMNMFGFKYKALYQPLVFMVFRMIIGQSISGPVIGAIVGHLYYFLVEVMPTSHGYSLIKTPKFCDSIVAYGTSSGAAPAVGGGFGQAAAAAPAAAPAGGGGGANAGAPGLRNRFGGTAGTPSAAGGGYNWGGGGRALGSQ